MATKEEKTKRLQQLKGKSNYLKMDQPKVKTKKPIFKMRVRILASSFAWDIKPLVPCVVIKLSMHIKDHSTHLSPLA